MTREEIDALPEPERAAAIMLVFVRSEPNAKLSVDEMYDVLADASRGEIVALMYALQKQATIPTWRKGERFNP